MSENCPSWWDPYSNQPYKLGAEERRRYDLVKAWEYLTVLATALGTAPSILWHYLSLKPIPFESDARSFVGLSVTPDTDYDNAVKEMVDELGVEELLVRVPTWESDRIDDYANYIQGFSGKRFLINILQSRNSVTKPEQWRAQLRLIFATLGPSVSYFQIGNAINRAKWGCAHPGEYLRLLEIAEEVRQDFPQIKLVGSSVIDFEPLVTLRTLRNHRRYALDVVSSLMYVNRRGSPYGRQFGVFDLQNKLRLVRAIVSLGNRNVKRLWITEMNWPLLNTKPYTPNSGHPRSTVDEPTQAEYLKMYYQIAYQTGWVEKLYWWQLINPGYGLVDHRGKILRKHPSYFALKAIINGELYKPPADNR